MSPVKQGPSTVTCIQGGRREVAAVWLRLSRISISSPSWGGEGQAPRGCVKSPWSCDRSGNWPQDRKEPAGPRNLSRGQSAYSGSTYESPGVGQSSQPQGLPLSLFPSCTDLLHLPPRSEQEEGEQCTRVGSQEW